MSPFITREDTPLPYSTIDADGRRRHHGKGGSWLGQANLSLGGGQAQSEATKEAIREGWCCLDAKLTNWHGRQMAGDTHGSR